MAHGKAGSHSSACHIFKPNWRALQPSRLLQAMGSTMTPLRPRPEDRSRGSCAAVDGPHPEPACFRSEGFAEDLHESVQAGPTPVLTTATLREWLSGNPAAWRGAQPALGVAFAALLGLVGR
jgi:hypothetical protein